MSKRIVIIGATSAIAHYCARYWAGACANQLVLVGRDAGRLVRVKSDLSVHGPAATIDTRICDFLDAAAIAALVDDVVLGGVPDIVLIAHGALPEQSICEKDLTACKEALEINGLSPVLFAEAFAQHFATAGKGTLAVISSVAGDRGRKSNYIYGAAKGLVTRYVQGLQHRFAPTGVRIVLIKPGPTDTPMTAQFKAQGMKLATVGEVGEIIIAAIEQTRPEVYAPRKWWLVMQVIRHLPSSIFNRLNI